MAYGHYPRSSALIDQFEGIVTAHTVEGTSTALGPAASLRFMHQCRCVRCDVPVDEFRASWAAIPDGFLTATDRSLIPPLRPHDDHRVQWRNRFHTQPSFPVGARVHAKIAEGAMDRETAPSQGTWKRVLGWVLILTAFAGTCSAAATMSSRHVDLNTLFLYALAGLLFFAALLVGGFLLLESARRHGSPPIPRATGARSSG